HQTSVYVGAAGGMVLAGSLAERFGWRSPFWVLGIAGMIFAAWIATQIVEPVRGQSEKKKSLDLSDDLLLSEPPNFARNLVEIVTTPASAALLGVFIGANFVAAVFLTWLPSFIGRKVGLGLAAASLTSTVWPLASLVGALLGGYLADRASAQTGGRIRVQALGLLVAAPFVLATTRADTVSLVVAASLGLGLCKGIYDA